MVRDVDYFHLCSRVSEVNVWKGMGRDGVARVFPDCKGQYEAAECVIRVYGEWSTEVARDRIQRDISYFSNDT